MQRCVMRGSATTGPLAVGLVALLSLGAPRAPQSPAPTPATVDHPSPEAWPVSANAPKPSAERAASAASQLSQASCPAGTLPDGDACVHFHVGRDGAEHDEGASSPEAVNSHRDTLGRWVVYEEIPRRPDRPADYGAYRYPVPCEARGCVASGYDLDRSDEQQRRTQRLRDVGHGAVDLPEPKGTPVRLVPLEHQEGDAEVVYVGPLFGTTVVTRHTVREGGRLRDYLILFGHLDAASPGLTQGSPVHEGDVVGLVGDSGSPGLVHLHLEARRLRDGVDPAKLAPSALVDGTESIVCDPRNVLPLR
jgi:murein DD-endopeptidase MepM/ murein hydrolase activator NlpD